MFKEYNKLEEMEKYPNASLHQVISFIKSFIRIGGCGFGLYFNSLEVALWSLLVAEIVGIIEELV